MVGAGPRRLQAFFGGSLLRNLRFRLGEIEVLTAAWHRAVGAPIAEYVRPIRYANGRLVVQADSAAWAGRIRHQQTAVIRRLRETDLFSELNGMQISVAPAAPFAPLSEVAAPRPPSRLSDKVRCLIEAVATETRDPSLRAALKRLIDKVE